MVSSFYFHIFNVYDGLDAFITVYNTKIEGVPQHRVKHMGQSGPSIAQTTMIHKGVLNYGVYQPRPYRT